MVYLHICLPALLIVEMKQLSEAAEKATISKVKDVPSQKQQAMAAELGGLSQAEKKRLVAQYDCESDGDSEYPINDHLALHCMRKLSKRFLQDQGVRQCHISPANCNIMT